MGTVVRGSQVQPIAAVSQWRQRCGPLRPIPNIPGQAEERSGGLVGYPQWSQAQPLSDAEERLILVGPKRIRAASA